MSGGLSTASTLGAVRWPARVLAGRRKIRFQVELFGHKAKEAGCSCVGSRVSNLLNREIKENLFSVEEYEELGLNRKYPLLALNKLPNNLKYPIFYNKMIFVRNFKKSLLNFKK